MRGDDWEPYLGDVPRPTAGDLARLERRLGVALPDDYRAVAAAHAGETPRSGSVPVGRGSVPFGVLLLPMAPAGGDESSYTVEAQLAVLAEWSDGRAAGLVPVCDTTGHALICLDHRAGHRPSVVLVDLDRHLDDPRAVIPIARSFSELLDLLRR